MRDVRNRRVLNPSFKSAGAAPSHGISNLIRHARSSGVLNLSCRNLSEVPDEVYSSSSASADEGVNWWEVAELTKLDLNGNSIQEVPEALFSGLTALTGLNFSANNISQLPEAIQELQQLRSLAVTSNPLKALPEGVAHLPALANLACNDCQLQQLPSQLGSHAQPTFSALNASNNQLTALPSGLAAATALVKLQLSSNRLLELPDGMVAGWMCLQELDVSHNQLQVLPGDLGRLPSLRTLDASNNQLLSLPAGLAGASALLELHLGFNRITEVPEVLGMLAQLRLLSLCNNQLTDLPTSLCGLSLNLLDLRNNGLRALPPQLGTMTSLRSVPLDGNPLKLIRREVWSGPVSGLLEYLCSRLPDHPTAAAPFNPTTSGSSSSHPFPQQQQQLPAAQQPATAAGSLQWASSTQAHHQQQQQPPHTAAAPTAAAVSPSQGEAGGSSSTSVAGHVRGGELVLRHRGLQQLPSGLDQALLSGITRLDLSDNPLGSFPPALLLQPGAQQLRSLNLANTGLLQWPLPWEAPGALPHLTQLDVGGNRALVVPAGDAGLAAVPQLRALDLSGVASAAAAPPCFYAPVQQLQALVLVGVPLGQLGDELLAALPSSLTRLDVSSAGLTSVSPELTRLTRLEELYLTNNSLGSLPPLLGRMGPHLHCLQLDGNCLRTIRRQILDRGTAAVLEYLATRIPA